MNVPISISLNIPLKEYMKNLKPEQQLLTIETSLKELLNLSTEFNKINILKKSIEKKTNLLKDIESITTC